MSIFGDFFKKEAPLLGLQGSGGGLGFLAGRGGPTLATGGTKYTYNNKIIHVFTTTGPNPFIVPKDFTAEVFVVGGGGGGGGDMAGGGGAGGVRNLSSVPITSGTYVVTVGAGGYGANSPYPEGTVGNVDTSLRQGNDSSIGSIVVASGGGYGGWENGDSGPGGSGGGSHGRSPNNSSTVASPDGISPTTQGNAGGNSSGTFAGGAGGGGWGSAGSPPGTGGNGNQSPATFRDPSNPYGTPGPGGTFYFAGGGGAGKYQSTGVSGGYGGGGPGGNSPGSGGESATPGTTNTGGGGGGPGIVFIAYPDSTFP
jgi:hypothetical protein